jgi:hypothetical protein
LTLPLQLMRIGAAPPKIVATIWSLHHRGGVLHDEFDSTRF